MIFAVVQTHRKGVRLTRGQIRTAEPAVGQLVVSDWPQGSSANRAIRVAYLKHPTIEYYPNLVNPLFDPVLVRMSKLGFLLVGSEIYSEAGESVEYVQGWWAKVC